jgi:hypothetical protein
MNVKSLQRFRSQARASIRNAGLKKPIRALSFITAARPIRTDN